MHAAQRVCIAAPPCLPVMRTTALALALALAQAEHQAHTSVHQSRLCYGP